MSDHVYVILSERTIRHATISKTDLLRKRGINPDLPYSERQRPGSSVIEFTQPPLPSDLSSSGELHDVY
jgi:hypothetical protein